LQVGIERGGIIGLEGHAGKSADQALAPRLVVSGLDNDTWRLFEQDRRRRRRGAVQPDDVLVERRGPLQVIDEYADGCQAHGRAHFCLRWNMASMRCVTRKPPKILTEAKVSATKPSARAHSGPSSLLTSATPTASSAPTTITEEIALVTDISGVCSAGVTDHTTKYPTNTASTKIDSRNTKGSTTWATCSMASLSLFRLEVRMNDGAVLGQQGRLHQSVVPVPRERLARFVDHRL